MPTTRHAFFTSEFLAQLRASLAALAPDLPRRVRASAGAYARTQRRFCDYRAYGVGDDLRYVD